MKARFCVPMLCLLGSLGVNGAVDPKLDFSTYLGGDGRESAVAVAVSSQGQVYVLGNQAFGRLDTLGAPLIRHVSSTPPGFPPGFEIPTDPDVFIVKYAPGLQAVEYFALLGGTGSETAIGLEVDPQGNPVILLRTESADFPTKNALVPALPGDSGFALVKLSADGRELIFSTFLDLGGALPGFLSFLSGVADLALDGAGQIYLTGTTGSANFPVTGDAFQRQFGGGDTDAFVAKLASDGSRLLYATYLGGNLADFGQAIAVDAQGNAFVGGTTTSPNFPLMRPFNAERGVPDPFAGEDPEHLFLTKLNPAGSTLEFSTFLIGGGDVHALALTPQGGVVIAGQTSGGLTTTANAWQRLVTGGFVLELNPSLTAVAYSTHLGGSPAGLAIDAAGNLAVTGAAAAASWRATHAGFVPDNPLNQSAEAFVLKLDTARRAVFSFLLGGLDADAGRGVAFLPSGELALVGSTGSFDFPLVNATREFAISDEAFVTRVSETPAASGTGPGVGDLVSRQYRDRDSANLPKRFYRVRELPP